MKNLDKLYKEYEDLIAKESWLKGKQTEGLAESERRLELIETRIELDNLRNRIWDTKRRNESPICAYIDRKLSLTEDMRDYIKEICDMSLVELRLSSAKTFMVEELQKRIEYEELLEPDDLDTLSYLIQVCGESGYLGLYPEGMVDKLEAAVDDTRADIVILRRYRS
jgi:hypothetical protein